MCRRIPIDAIDALELKRPCLQNRQVRLPASKSITNRALMLQALAGVGRAAERSGAAPRLENVALCDDSRSMQEALSSNAALKDIGAAGTAMRFLTAYYAATASEQPVVLTGSERMKHRPIALLVDALRSLGADIAYLENEGFPPLRIKGRRLRGGELHIDGSVSSQYLSALLMVAPLGEEALFLHIDGKINSRPYLQMTLSMMQSFGVKATWEGNVVHVPAQAYQAPAVYRIEYDWSAASYWFEMVALSDDASVLLLGLRPDSIQGDARVLDWFRPLGVEAGFVEGGLQLRSAGRSACPSRSCKPLAPFEADFSQQPDLAQTFVVTCAMQGRHFCLSGLESLRIKETDRLAALVTEMRKLGFVLQVEGATLSWLGERSEPSQLSQPVRIATYQDHRMAMAFAPVILKWQGPQPILIENPKVVSKSYPEFFDQFFQS